MVFSILLSLLSGELSQSILRRSSSGCLLLLKLLRSFVAVSYSNESSNILTNLPLLLKISIGVLSRVVFHHLSQGCQLSDNEEHVCVSILNHFAHGAFGLFIITCFAPSVNIGVKLVKFAS